MDKQQIVKNVSITFICIILGFVISIQLKSVRTNSMSTNTTARNEELQKMLTAEKDRTASLQEQISQMQDTIDNYRTSIEQTGSAYAGLENDLSRAENLAGMLDVYGPGIVITLEDAKMPEGGGAAEQYILHDTDIRSVVNELLASGAEAVSINDERIVSNTAIRCVGPVIMVNNVRISTPVVIKAIGDATGLENAMNMNGGILSELRYYNFGINVQKSERIDIAAYKGNVTFKYLTPAKKEE